MKKIVVSDYDNTFYRNDDDIEKNKLKVKEFMELSNIFIIATGRSYLDFMEKEDLYKIKYNYLILDHGATILKYNEIIFTETINNSIKEDLLYDLQPDDITWSFACCKLESRVSFQEKDLTKIHVRYETEEMTRKIHDFIKDKYKDYIDAFLVCKNKGIEIVSNKVNKSVAIKFISQLENTTDIYTIGDSYNDLCMIEDFKGFIMNDSIEELKSKGYKQYDSVSLFIEDVLKNEI